MFRKREMIETLDAHQFDDLRKLIDLTDDDGNVDNDNLETALYNRLLAMGGIVEFYDHSPNLTVKAYRLMIEYLEGQILPMLTKRIVEVTDEDGWTYLTWGENHNEQT